MMIPTTSLLGTRFHGWRLPVLIVAIVASMVALFLWQFTVVVDVENVGEKRMMSVAIEDWNGAVYEIGEIEPGESASVITFPSGDAGASLLWRTDCILRSTPIAGYMALGRNGRLAVRANGRGVIVP